MANHVSLLFCFFSSITVLAMAFSCSASTDEEREVYIVYMGSVLEGGDYSPTSQHLNMLQQVTSSGEIELVRSYKRSFNGFAAKLTKDEKQKIASFKEVVSVFPNTILKPQTTRSWDFMGLNETADRKLTVESDIIVGVIDTGVWPESDSFKDDGFGPPPKKWKGECNGGTNFTCNNKVIGARFYTSDSTARDGDGHGSHTASTAAGSKVSDASFYGIAKGTARGGVPSARIAVYKVCDAAGCRTADILAAFDDAIADGVDVITISIGGDRPAHFEADSIAIGAFHAMDKGILTSHSAGNSGPDGGTIVSVAPWILSVAASSLDRKIVDRVVLGDGMKLWGISVNSFSLNETKVPLVYGKEVSSSCSEASAGSCSHLCLEKSLVKGMIVLCDVYSGMAEASRAGALGMITVMGGSPDVSFVVPLPVSALSQNDYDLVKSYHMSSKKPKALITKSEGVKDYGAPRVASFSGRGPNTILPDILKPDVSAPGVNVFAAYSPLASPSDDPNDPRRVNYNILSGTSMSCPHAAGVAAYVKSFHPDWSPSAIKSAIMTTAWRMKGTENGNPEFDHGSGHINPVNAISPGLVYETGKEDYIQLLCSAGYSDDAIKQISGHDTTCKKASGNTSPKDMNYPSMSASVPSRKSFNITFARTVTNVGLANSTYKSMVLMSHKMTVKVVPEVLSFEGLNEKRTFVVTVAGRGVAELASVSGSLTWLDGTHEVRSPIVVHSVVLVKPSFE